MTPAEMRRRLAELRRRMEANRSAERPCCIDSLNTVETWFTHPYNVAWREAMESDDPPKTLPILPFDGLCQRTGGVLCDHAQQSLKDRWAQEYRMGAGIRELNRYADQLPEDERQAYFELLG